MPRLVDEEDNEIEVEDGDELNYITALDDMEVVDLTKSDSDSDSERVHGYIEAGVLDIKQVPKIGDSTNHYKISRA